MILSFAYTAAAYLAKRKTVTRREWSDKTFSMWKAREGQRFDAWSRSPRFKGIPIGTSRLVSVTWEHTCDMPDSDWEAQGFAYMSEHGLLVGPSQTCSEFWEAWRSDREKV
ncbi:MAG TPA: hypothetical protein VG944_02690, partial [Fimbriimonas sp.]|nr:hypothetical protein [Fimbriimonas sp.]